jgi:hypothetical protein
MSSRLLGAMAVALLMPLIVAAGIVALAGMLMLSASRHLLIRAPATRQSARTLPVHLETSAPEATLSHAA